MDWRLFCLMVKYIHDSHGTVSNSFGPFLRDLQLKIEEIYEKCSNLVSFELEKCSFFKWVRLSPEIDWYHYQGASPAPTCLVRNQTMTKTPTRWSVTSESSVRGYPPSVKIINFFNKKTNKYVKNAMKHEKTKDIKMTPPPPPHPWHPTWMLTTCSHLSEGVKKYSDEFPWK